MHSLKKESDESESFQIEQFRTGFAFKNLASGLYVSAEPMNNNSRLIADRTTAQAWELFQLKVLA
jgi:hypothetical protein